MEHYLTYKYFELNPKTNLPVNFNKDYYKSKQVQVFKDKLPDQGALIFKIARKDIVTLAAYGVQSANAYDILCTKYTAMKHVDKRNYGDHVSKLCTYYSLHLNELHQLIGNFTPEAEALIDAYENKNNVVLSIGLPTEEDIRNCIQKLISYSKLNIPVDFNPREINKKEKELKNQFIKTSSKKVMSKVYGELLQLAEQRVAYEKDQEHYKEFRALKDLESCGVIEACLNWLSEHPYIH